MNDYIEKHAFCEQEIAEAPLPGLGLVIVIPCFNETGLLKTLDSLAACTLPQCKTEVIVVINSAANCEENILEQNRLTELELQRWILKNEKKELRYFFIVKDDLPPKDAGVGLARKIGMDETVRRFDAACNENGVIVCLDADSTVESNYLVALENHFLLNPATTGCSVYFEHPLEGAEFEPSVYEGIIRYELFLRYYNYGLRCSGYPFAFHTIGSCMAVRTKIYQQQGGMNKRKAGEDFYFLSKIFPAGGFTELNETTVYPSPRPSLRVPFGTGKTITRWLEEKTNSFPVYHPKTFTDLAGLFALVPGLYDLNTEQVRQKTQDLSSALLNFLANNNYENKLAEINSNISSKKQFVKRFYQWFNNFMVLKFVHFARDNYYPQVEIKDAATELLRADGNDVRDTVSVKELLYIYRKTEQKKI